MTIFKATLRQIRRKEFTLEDIREIFQEMNIETVEQFKQNMAIGAIKVPSFASLNALCIEQRGVKFEKFFFGGLEFKKERYVKLIDSDLVLKIKNWCADNQITTIYEYKQKKRPPDFPTYKSTIDNYGEAYFSDVLGLKKYKDKLSEKIIDDKFIKKLRDWCLKNKISSRTEYQLKKPDSFPSNERIRQLAPEIDYFSVILGLDFRNIRRRRDGLPLN